MIQNVFFIQNNVFLAPVQSALIRKKKKKELKFGLKKAFCNETKTQI